MGLQITSGTRKVIQLVNFSPRVALGESSAHSVLYGRLQRGMAGRSRAATKQESGTQHIRRALASRVWLFCCQSVARAPGLMIRPEAKAGAPF